MLNLFPFNCFTSHIIGQLESLRIRVHDSAESEFLEMRIYFQFPIPE